jgi:hypothetical protein
MSGIAKLMLSRVSSLKTAGQPSAHPFLKPFFCGRALFQIRIFAMDATTAFAVAGVSMSVNSSFVRDCSLEFMSVTYQREIHFSVISPISIAVNSIVRRGSSPTFFPSLTTMSYLPISALS